MVCFLGRRLHGLCLLLILPYISAVISGLLGVCAGFFTIHAAAIGSLNRKLDNSQGRANALYVLFYYLGGVCGITLSGLIYEHFGWNAVILLCLSLLILPLLAGRSEKKSAALN